MKQKSAKAKASAKCNTDPARLGRTGFAGLEKNWKETWSSIVRKYPELNTITNLRLQRYIASRVRESKTRGVRELDDVMRDLYAKLVICLISYYYIIICFKLNVLTIMLFSLIGGKRAGNAKCYLLVVTISWGKILLQR